MKKYNLIFMSLLMIVAVSVKAQQIGRIKKGENNKNPTLDRFVGTWISKTDTAEVIFYFNKENIDFTHYKMDFIVGFHKFLINGTTLSDNSSWKGKSIKENHSSFSGTNSRNVNELAGYFAENDRSLRWALSFIISPDGKSLTMTATAKPQAGVNLPKIEASKFPKKLVFKKQ